MINEIKLDGSLCRFISAVVIDTDMLTHYGNDFLLRQKLQVKNATLREFFSSVPEGIPLTIKTEYFTIERHDGFRLHTELRYEIQYAAVREIRQEVRIITNSFENFNNYDLGRSALQEVSYRIKNWFKKNKPYMAD